MLARLSLSVSALLLVPACGAGPKVDCRHAVAGNDPAPMCRVEGGTFRIGCDPARGGACQPEALPLHEVAVAAFFIDRTEVTAAAYGKCVTAGACRANGLSEYCDGLGCHADPSQRYCIDPSAAPQLPINCVAWTDAKKYCEWAGKRLPSEAEWEIAARGDDGRLYPWGDEEPTCERAVLFLGEGYDARPGCGRDAPWEVGAHPKGDSPWGAADLAGNVTEWVQDSWFDSYEGAPADGSARESTDTFPSRVLRGSSFMSVPFDTKLHASWRGGNYDFRDHRYGFRCASSTAD